MEPVIASAAKQSRPAVAQPDPDCFAAPLLAITADKSSTLEARFALFVERGNAFAAVFGWHHAVVGLDFEHHAGGEVHLQAVMDRMLGLPHRNRRVVGDSARRFPRFLDDLRSEEHT